MSDEAVGGRLDGCLQGPEQPGIVVLGLGMSLLIVNILVPKCGGKGESGRDGRPFKDGALVPDISLLKGNVVQPQLDRKPVCCNTALVDLHVQRPNPLTSLAASRPALVH